LKIAAWTLVDQASGPLFRPASDHHFKHPGLQVRTPNVDPQNRPNLEGRHASSIKNPQLEHQRYSNITNTRNNLEQQEQELPEIPPNTEDSDEARTSGQPRPVEAQRGFLAMAPATQIITSRPADEYQRIDELHMSIGGSHLYRVAFPWSRAHSQDQPDRFYHQQQ
jgi:hypothetical protein